MRTPWARDYWRLGEQPSEQEIQLTGRHVQKQAERAVKVAYACSLLLLTLAWLLALSAWFEENAAVKLAYSAVGLVCFVFSYVSFRSISEPRTRAASFFAGEFKVIRGHIGDIYADSKRPPNEISVLFVPETEELRAIRVCMPFDGSCNKGDPAFVAVKESASGQIGIWPMKS